MSACLDCGGRGGHFPHCDRDARLTADTVCECEHDRGSHDGLGNCWHVDRGTGEEDCDCDQFRIPASQADEGLRDALRIHHPIMRSETGPFSGCRCGAVGLGQDVIAHVVAELRRALDQP